MIRHLLVRILLRLSKALYILGISEKCRDLHLIKPKYIAYISNQAFASI
ncbi:hypothetical protein [Acinetobacter sp.]|jgi:hypothetical protein